MRHIIVVSFAFKKGKVIQRFWKSQAVFLFHISSVMCVCAQKCWMITHTACCMLSFSHLGFLTWKLNLMHTSEKKIVWLFLTCVHSTVRIASLKAYHFMRQVRVCLGSFHFFMKIFFKRMAQMQWVHEDEIINREHVMGGLMKKFCMDASCQRQTTVFALYICGQKSW